MNIKKHPAAVMFGEIECCVLRHALSDKKYASLLDAVIEKVSMIEIISHQDFSFLGESFAATSDFIFIPGTAPRVFYNGVACAEKKAIFEGSRSFSCDHTEQEHMKALDRIIWLTACPQGQN